MITILTMLTAFAQTCPDPADPWLCSSACVASDSVHLMGLSSTGTWNTSTGSGPGIPWPTGTNNVDPRDYLWDSIDGDDEFGCGIRKDDGGIYCWANNNDSNQVTNAPQDSDVFVQVEASDWDRGLGLTILGEVVAWGSNSGGFVTGAPTGTGYTDISTGQGVGCAVDSAGTLDCWNTDFPVMVSACDGTANVDKVAVFGQGALLLKTNGTIDICGNLGDSTTFWLKKSMPSVAGATDVFANEASTRVLGVINSDGTYTLWQDPNAVVSSIIDYDNQHVAGTFTVTSKLTPAYYNISARNMCVIVDDPDTTPFNEGEAIVWGQSSGPSTPDVIGECQQ